MRLLEGSFTLYTSLSVRVSRIGAKLVCLSITSKQAKVAPECCQAVQGWKWRCPLIVPDKEKNGSVEYEEKGAPVQDHQQG